jgi:hypothetical protein
MSTHRFQSALILSLALGIAAPAAADASASGSWNAALRWRFELVDDEAFAREAQAHTARLRLGWTQRFNEHVSAFIEAEGVAELNDSFNSGANRETTYPVVLDARAAEINQAGIEARWGKSVLRVGRQRIALDNQRFVGNVGWRQNEQTFDALAFEQGLGEKTKLRYHWLGRVHRVAGNEAIDPLAREHELDAHLFNLETGLPLGKLGGYAYQVEDRDLAAWSTRTLGVRWVADIGDEDLRWGWTIEGAMQQDAADHPADFSAGYALVEGSLTTRGHTFRLGVEELGSDNGVAFQTPLATLHAFNGWADRFLSTPVDGLRDAYVAVNAAPRGWAWALSFHDFSEPGGRSYGQEWDASLGRKFGKGWSALAKVADYHSDGFAQDTRKVWLQVEWAH